MTTLAAADTACRAALAADPNDADALDQLARIQLERAPEQALSHLLHAHAARVGGRHAESVRAAREALRRAPADVEALNLLGLSLRDLGDLDQAVAVWQRAVRTDPALADLWLNLGKALCEAGRAEDALAPLAEALSRRPDHGDSLLALGNALIALERAPEAAAAFERGLAGDPRSARLHANLALARRQCGDLDGAEHHLRQAVALAPALAEAHKNLAMLDLLRGRFADGFDRFAWRWREQRAFNRPRPLPQPPWDGSALGGRTILVWGEQGVGDEIMFASAYPEVIAAAARCVVECEARLVPLFQRSFTGARMVARTEPPAAELADPAIDLQCAAGDLCRWLRRSREDFPVPAPYLLADPGRIAAAVARVRALGDGPKVGLAWRSRTPVWGAAKSAPLALWDPILSVPGPVWIDLQYGDCADERAAARARLGVTVHHDPSVDQMASLDDFAAQVAALDLVITTSNTTAHMAGALGVETWLLLPHMPDWRWQATGEDSLWYPRTRLFRQPSPGDWRTPIESVAAALRGRL